MAVNPNTPAEVVLLAIRLGSAHAHHFGERQREYTDRILKLGLDALDSGAKEHHSMTALQLLIEASPFFKKKRGRPRKNPGNAKLNDYFDEMRRIESDFGLEAGALIGEASKQIAKVECEKGGPMRNTLAESQAKALRCILKSREMKIRQNLERLENTMLANAIKASSDAGQK